MYRFVAPSPKTIYKSLGAARILFYGRKLQRFLKALHDQTSTQQGMVALLSIHKCAIKWRAFVLLKEKTVTLMYATMFFVIASSRATELLLKQ